MSYAEDLHCYFRFASFPKPVVTFDEVERGRAYGSAYVTVRIELTEESFLDLVVEELAAPVEPDEDPHGDMEKFCLRTIRSHFADFCDEAYIKEYDANGHNDFAFEWKRLDATTIEAKASLPVSWIP